MRTASAFPEIHPKDPGKNKAESYQNTTGEVQNGQVMWEISTKC